MPRPTAATPGTGALRVDLVAIAILDIDGVVADVRHRLHYLESRPKDWMGFFRAAAADEPIPEGMERAHALAEEHDLVWLSGRPQWLAAMTTKWLSQHGLPASELHLRPNRDHRPARLFKLDVLRRLADREIATFVDDDAEVVGAATAAGFPALLADWMPRETVLREAQDRLGRT
jgi:uncharacterized HAD superfamily protein